MIVHAPDVIFQLCLLQYLGPAVLSVPVVHRALFSTRTPLAKAQAMLPRLQTESSFLAAELTMPQHRFLPRGGAVATLVVGGDADLFLPVCALHESADHWHAERHILAGAPHALIADPHYWRPSAEIILGWLERRRGT